MNNEQIKKIIGQRIKHYRKIKSLTQRELAAELGVNFTYIANIKQGHKGISLEKVVELCMRFRCSYTVV